MHWSSGFQCLVFGQLCTQSAGLTFWLEGSPENCLWKLFLIVIPGAQFYLCSSYISRQNQESWELHDKLPITWLGLQFWKLCGGVERSPASVQMNKDTTVREMYGRGWYLDGKLYRLAHVTKYQIIQLRERPAVMWGIKKFLQLLFDVNSS